MDLMFEASPVGQKQLLIIQEQGETVPLDIVINYDITNTNIKGTIAFPTPVSLLLGDNITMNDAAIGHVTLQLGVDDTKDVPAGRYGFDLWTISPGGSVKNAFMNGYFVITQAETDI